MVFLGILLTLLLSSVIDIHCHILADVDDGPKSWDVAEEMCRMAAADGIEHIVATPHANERYPYDRKFLNAELARLQQRITPVITHPERNPILQQDLPRVLRWVELGCAVQVTASALTGDWGERVWRSAEWLLKRDAVHVLATDAHDTRHRRPVLSAAREAAEETCSADVARALVDDNPRAIIGGRALPYFPNPVVGR